MFSLASSFLLKKSRISAPLRVAAFSQQRACLQPKRPLTVTQKPSNCVFCRLPYPDPLAGACPPSPARNDPFIFMHTQNRSQTTPHMGLKEIKYINKNMQTHAQLRIGLQITGLLENDVMHSRKYFITAH